MFLCSALQWRKTNETRDPILRKWSGGGSCWGSSGIKSSAANGRNASCKCNFTKNRSVQDRDPSQDRLLEQLLQEKLLKKWTIKRFSIAVCSCKRSKKKWKILKNPEYWLDPVKLHQHLRWILCWKFQILPVKSKQSQRNPRRTAPRPQWVSKTPPKRNISTQSKITAKPEKSHEILTHSLKSIVSLFICRHELFECICLSLHLVEDVTK